MISYTKNKRSVVKIALLGASFETSNMGVSALAESAVKCILNRWPGAEIFLLACGTEEEVYKLNLSGREVWLEVLPIRFSANIFLSGHVCRLAFYQLLTRVFPFRWLREGLYRKNKYFREMVDIDLVVDISGGDSFSDIYGVFRFLKVMLRKMLVIIFGKKMILLPQTYGPYKRAISRGIAKYVLNHASRVYSRDREGIGCVKDMLKLNGDNEKVYFSPDLAFVLDRQKPVDSMQSDLAEFRNSKKRIIGLNISGLLYNGGFNQNNMFGLKADYKRLILDVVEWAVRDTDNGVLLVPHVYAKPTQIECDPDACRDVYEKMRDKYPGRIYCVRGGYSQNEIKYIIGMCDFFIGSRMHSCIAAMSQFVPTVGLAYSKKFFGVFESIGTADSVVNMCNESEDKIFETINKVFAQRDQIRTGLEKTIPNLKSDILNIFEDIKL